MAKKREFHISQFRDYKIKYDGPNLIGFDPSLTSFGVALLSKDNLRTFTISFPSTKTIRPKGIHTFRQIMDVLHNCIKDHGTGVNIIAVEGYSFHSAGDSITDTIEVGTCMRLAVVSCGCCVFEIPPKRVKMFATLNGSASKPLVKQKMSTILRSPVRTTDEADAASIVLIFAEILGYQTPFHAHTEVVKVNRALKEMRKEYGKNFAKYAQTEFPGGDD